MNHAGVAFDPCGIEVSRQVLVVALRLEDHDQPLREFPNTPAGHQALLRYLARSGRSVRVAMESTGLYGLDLALTLHQAGVAVMVANPRAVRSAKLTSAWTGSCECSKEARYRRHR